MPTYRYPVLLVEDAARGFTAVPVDCGEGLVGFAPTPREAVEQMREFLTWSHRRGGFVPQPDFRDADLAVLKVSVRPEYRAGDRIQAYVVDIEKNARGPQIILSRGHKGLLEKLFEQEVSEIYEKIVRIEASAREPGARSKIAVSSRDRDVDPVGACVGMKGSRVQAVVQELRGEKIDIVPYSDDPARFGRPRDFVVTVREVRLSAGAGFAVPLTGEMMTMPGLPREPAALRVRLMPDGKIRGLMQND